MTGLKLPFWGLSFVEFWCWGLIFGGQGGPGAPLDPPLQISVFQAIHMLLSSSVFQIQHGGEMAIVANGNVVKL